MVKGRRSGDENRYGSMPLFTSGGGMVRRTCTHEYKITPLEKFMKREILKLRPRQRAPKEVRIHNWFGISLDETQRMRDSREAWKRNIYPLIGMPFKYLNNGFTRHDCRIWLNTHYPGHYVPRSACIGCPFHSDHEWRMLKFTAPEEFADACEVDKMIRRCAKMKSDTYLHRSCLPLYEVDFRTAEDLGQYPMFSADCEGMCGV